MLSETLKFMQSQLNNFKQIIQTALASKHLLIPVHKHLYIMFSETIGVGLVRC